MDLIPKLGKLFFVTPHNKNNQIINPDDNNINAKDGFDVVSSTTKLQPDHLVIMVNGIIGR